MRRYLLPPIRWFHIPHKEFLTCFNNNVWKRRFKGFRQIELCPNTPGTPSHSQMTTRWSRLKFMTSVADNSQSLISFPPLSPQPANQPVRLQLVGYLIGKWSRSGRWSLTAMADPRLAWRWLEMKDVNWQMKSPLVFHYGWNCSSLPRNLALFASYYLFFQREVRRGLTSFLWGKIKFSQPLITWISSFLCKNGKHGEPFCPFVLLQQELSYSEAELRSKFESRVFHLPLLLKIINAIIGTKRF